MQPPHRVPAFQKASDKFPWPHVLSKWNPQHHNFSCCFLFGKFPVHLPQSVWDTLTPDDFPVRLLQSRRHTHPSDRDLLKNIQNFSHTMGFRCRFTAGASQISTCRCSHSAPTVFPNSYQSVLSNAQAINISVGHAVSPIPAEHLYKKSI